jgi:hypothetical protein
MTALAERTDAELEKSPTGPDAPRLLREILAINSNIASLAGKLRLTPSSVVSGHARGVLGASTPRSLDDLLIGGSARVLRQ